MILPPRLVLQGVISEIRNRTTTTEPVNQSNNEQNTNQQKSRRMTHGNIH